MSLRCLLIGPNEQGEQATGEDTYVRSLLEKPPAGVEYVHYSALLAEGKAVRVPWVHALFSRLARYGLLRPAPWLETLASEEAFDLVHVHGFNVRLEGRIAQCPLILGTSSYAPANCITYLGWSKRKAAAYHRRLRLLFRLLKISDACNNPRRAQRVLVWSEYARGLHLAHGRNAEQLAVAPPGVEVPPVSWERPTGRPAVLFVGRDFHRKGGEVLLEAWKQIPAGAAHLTMIGMTDGELPPGVEHYPYISPLALNSYFYTRSHIFAFPTLAEGYGMALLEAMAHGLAVVASRIEAIPEMVADGETGFLVLPGDAEALAKWLRELIDQPRRCRQMGEAGRERAIRFFSIARRNELLGEVYRAALGDGASVGKEAVN